MCGREKKNTLVLDVLLLRLWLLIGSLSPPPSSFSRFLQLAGRLECASSSKKKKNVANEQRNPRKREKKKIMANHELDNR